MLRFCALRGGREAEGWPLRYAGLVGPDGSGLGGRVAFEDGLLVVTPAAPTPVSLSLLFPVDRDSGQPHRELLLSTTLLPQHDRPYLLSLELARKQVMRFLNALEAWRLAELPATHPALSRFERAREDFSAALVAWRSVRLDAGRPPADAVAAADEVARRALRDGVEAGDLLVDEAVSRGLASRADGSRFADALSRAESSLGRPAKQPVAVVKAPESRGVVVAGVARVGCVVQPGRQTPQAQDAVVQAADFVTVPMPWSSLEPQEGRYSFAATDRWIEWAVRTARLPVTAGPILDLGQGRLPEWLYIWENDYETMREIVYEHMRQVVTRYRRTVQWWTLASSLGVADAMRLRFEQVSDLLRVAATVTRKLHPQGRVQVEIVDPLSLYTAQGQGAIPPLLLAELIAQSGIGVDAIGLRLDLTRPGPAGVVRDAMALSEALDAYADLDRPISITFAACPSTPLTGERAADQGEWEGPWSPKAQASWLRRMLVVAASKPYVHSVCWGAAQDATEAGVGLVDRDGADKPARSALAAVRDAAQRGAPPEPAR